MIGKNTIKLIKSLAIKKYRMKEGLFLVEGDKIVSEVLHSQIKIKELIVTPEFDTSSAYNHKHVERTSEADYKELKQASLLQHPQNSIAICRLPKQQVLPDELNASLSIYLDGIQDPGNLGTIIRICDWYGIENVFCSSDTVDLYNPKVIQASMGSFMRIKFIEARFETIAELAHKSNTQLFGAFMDGDNIYKEVLPEKALLILGNEGKGIRSTVESLIDRRISIPNFSNKATKAESLNVSVAAAIICSEFKRMR